MEIGKMVTKKEWAAIYMEMVFIWVSVTLDSDTAKEYIYLKMVLATRAAGSKEKERAGASTNMLMEASIPVSIGQASEKVSACMNIIIKKLTKEIGKKTKRMAMGSRY